MEPILSKKELDAFNEIFRGELSDKEIIDINAGVTPDEELAFIELQEKLHHD